MLRDVAEGNEKALRKQKKKNVTETVINRECPKSAREIELSTKYGE